MKQLFVASAAFFVAAPALAQDAPPPPPTEVPAQAVPTQTAPAAAVTPAPQQAEATVAQPQCELHIWPAERFQSVTSGWGSSFGMLGALADAASHAKGDKARRSQIASALDSEGQLHALQQLDLVNLLHLQPSRIIIHAEALDPKTVDRVTTRRSDSTAACYSELIVKGVLYQKAAMWGRSLRTTFILREFNNGSANPLVKKTTGGNGLKIFPAKEGEDMTAADAELVSIFQKNFTEAAENFAKQAGS
jgi:hypothetical protein